MDENAPVSQLPQHSNAEGAIVRPYAEVIGDPISHSKSPVIHGFWLEKLGIAGDYRATNVTADDLPAFIEQRRADPAWRGCNVTIPHKVAMLDLVADPGGVRDSIGAMNTVVRNEGGDLFGTNTDAAGFYAPLKAAALLSRFGLKGDVLPLTGRLPAAKLLVNTSALGMEGQPPLDLDLLPLPSDAVVYDIVYAPLHTPLLDAAEARGLETIDGLEMLVGQAAAAFELFFGQPAPREHDGELRELLIQ